ncbi:polymorphic toxin-type HINT domain-containing protein [Amycolatopsis roodepoortensis]|uniref:RHS repeat-associated core domain-containing protein n=1 Tax=Amycolatopsis roodepoortensis TaxID=700274 RepID=UPI00214B211F|nr:RHS repeat-associated core domain-containing protein [Amycolatopsis roodepoortensis]UUV28308.1 polymorphic toxin-type HINT domain-containing protein [Amycolatopsis roodepoortensis]
MRKETRWTRIGRFSRVTSLAVSAIMLASGGAAIALESKGNVPGWSLGPGQKDQSVPVTPLVAPPSPPPMLPDAKVTPPVWPGATEAEVELRAGARDGRQPQGLGVQSAANGTPVKVGWARAKDLTARKAGPAPKARVRVADQKTSEALGLRGVVLTVADTGVGTEPVNVAVDYGAFGNAYGGGWADRLQLVELPGCALATPEKAECRTKTPVPGTVNNGKARQVSADVALAGAAPRVFAVTAAASGSAGNVSAQPLSAAGSWSSGGSSGAFSYNYPFAAPAAPSGAVPSLALSYSSSGVDGLTSATNNQSSWVGDGWDFTPGGYVVRNYLPCSEDLGGNNGQTKTGDQCWGIDNATLVLGGKSTELIKLAGTNQWRPKNDDGSKIELLGGAANNAQDGQHWKVTTGDGTQYFLGLNRPPGWSSGKPETQSTWTVPVFGNNDGEACYKPNNFAGSSCRQPWRWNLDYVVDPHGNASTYYYQPEINYYGLNQNVTTAGTEYTAGGYPLRIEYGLRLKDGSVYGSAPTNQIVFETAERCLPSGAVTCAPEQLNSTTASSWPDVPFEQICAKDKPCDYGSPAFFTRKRLTTVRTQYNNAGTQTDVDVWNLAHTFPGTGDASPSALWLSSVTHTGKGGVGSITRPATTFGGFMFANRVDTANDQYSPITRYRINEIRTETGGRIGVAYSGPDCVAGTRMPASPETDTMRCYASFWSPPSAKDPVLDWFHKYVVTDISEEDLTAGGVAVKTHYDYLGDAAWHYDEGQFTPKERKTWSQWRGYGVVRTSIGHPSATQTVTESLYLRGMDGDHLPNGGKRSVSVEDSEKGTIVDQDPLQGFLRESRTYLPGTTTVDNAAINDPWVRGPTATSADGLLKAHSVDTAAVRGRTLLSDGKTYRRNQVNKKFNDNGLVIEQEDLGDTGVTTDDTCTKTTYVPNTATGMFDKSSEVVMFAGLCSGTATASTVITNVKVSYDKQAFGAPPAAGDITRTETLSAWDATGKKFVTTATNEYDGYGRETLSTDVAGAVTKTAYTHSAGGQVAEVAVTNPLGWVSTTTKEPARGNPVFSVDVNKVRTDITYDALGRKTAVWNPGRSKLDGDKATATFEYTDASTSPTAVPTTVATKALQDNGQYTTSYAIYDGLGRTRQAQSAASGGGRIISDTVYDSRGLPFKSNNGYFNDASGPVPKLVTVADNTVLNQTVTEYDSRARATASILMSKGVKQWQTSTIYGGDRVTTIPPRGASPQTVVTDVHGQTVQRLLYTNGYTPGAANPADVTNYTYNAAGAMTSMADAAGNVWSTGYDLRGRKIWQTDPDAGRSTYTYDDGGQLTSSTDSRGKTVAYTYDKLGRKTQTNADSPTGTKLASWTYDTIPNGIGLPASSTRWVGTDAYVTRVVAYDRYGRPTKKAVDVPAVEKGLAGTYEFSTAYTATGAVASTVSPKAGNLPLEHVRHTYNELGLPSTTYAIDALGTTTNLVSKTDYTSFNEMSRMQFDGEKSTANVGVTQTYDEVTRRPQTTTVNRATQVGSQLTNRTYGYDPAGNVTKISDTPSGAPADTQCFEYDHQRRLTEAWTPSSGDCATAKSASALGGAAPYWKSYSFDKTGNRTKEIDHKSTGDVTSTSTYPAAGPTAVKPHALQKVDTSGPNGTSTSSYTYDEAGSLLTRNVGGDTQTFSYDHEGRTAGVTSPTGESKYLYDADGNRLVTRAPTGTTLSIGDLELVITTGTTGVSATRFYQHGGVQVAVRVGGSALKWMLGDLHGTNGLAITAGTLTPTQRYMDPFGNPRGPAPSTWPDKHGFVGGYQDATGLTHLGAREYDPAIGRFTKTDPVLDPAVPQLWNPYSYANNSPVTMTDPSGMSACFHMGEDGLFCREGTEQADYCNAKSSKSCTVMASSPSSPQGKKYAAAQQEKVKRGYNENSYKEAQAVVKKSKWDVFIDAAGELIKSLIGWDDIMGCIEGSVGSCISTLLNFIPWGKILKVGEIVASFWKGARALVTFGREVEKAQKVIADTERILADAATAANAVQVVVAVSEGEGVVGAAAAAMGGAAAASDSGCNSFVPGTQVLMSDGTTKPIEQVRIGDEVQTTDPETGGLERRRVVGTIVHDDEDERTEITVESGGVSDTIVATDWHLVWVEEADDWVAIGDLVPGQHLHSPDGRSSVVTAVRHFTQVSPVHDLTIDEIHAFFVGVVPSLVHNCGDGYVRPEGRFADKYSKISRSLGREVREVKDAIHDVKRQGKIGGARSNPDIMVDVDSGEIHTKLPCGCPAEDSIGNIHDYLSDGDDYGRGGYSKGRRR